MDRAAKIRATEPSCYLFIYLVQDNEECHRYCTVLAYGADLAAAERVAVGRVEEQQLRIVREDTATPAPWLDPASDGAYLDELARRGSALQLGEPYRTRSAAAG